MIRLQGANTRLRLDESTWHKEKTVFAVQCPDGIHRCVTIPNWKWNLWPRPTEAAPFQKETALAWRFAQAFAAHFNEEWLFADRLAFEIDLHHRGNAYRASNDNSPPSFWERLPRKRLAPWTTGEVSGAFNRRSTS